jgi:hypothetical protein
MSEGAPAARGLRVAIDWHMIGRPLTDDTDVGRYQQVLTTALAVRANPDDDIWALIAWPTAVDRIAPGIGHAGIGHRDMGRRRGDAHQMLARLAPDMSIFSHISPVRTRSPIAVVMHDALFATHHEWLGVHERGRTRAQSARAVRDARLVIAASEVARVDVVSVLDVPPERVHVVAPAPAAAFTRRSGAAARVAAHFGLDRYCMAIGDAGLRANLAHLTGAVACLGERGFQLVSADRAPRGRRGHGVVEGVRYLGPVSDDQRADLLSAARVAACVSFYDGCGIGALEALACGAPLVVSDRGALSEVVGDAALVVPPTVNGIAEGLRAAGDTELADRLRRAGPTRAAQFTHSRMGQTAWSAIRNAEQITG